MSTITNRTIGLTALLSTLVLWGPSVAPASPIDNGGFEAGSFTDWTVQAQPGSGGDWYVYSGTMTPLNGFAIPAPPEGIFAAVTDQSGPGSLILLRDLALEAGVRHSLTFTVYYENGAPGFVTPNTLDYSTVPNQQYRVDILRSSADPFSVAPADVLVQAFRTDVGEPNSLSPTPISVDLTPYAGTTVRLRFAQVNQDFFNAAVDDVRITTTSATCQAKTVTMLGTNGDDMLVGTPGADVILAGDGNDTIKGRGGKDLICAGDGNDTVSAGGGKDVVDGGEGNDRLKGQGGKDRLLGKAGNDRLNGGSGVDTCKGGPGRDRVTKCEKGRA